MNRAIAHTFSFHKEYKTIISYGLLGACALLGMIYSINLFSMISNTIAVKNLRSESNQIARSLEELDGQYLAISSNITPDKLSRYGLEQGKVSLFITKTASLGRVALSGHEL